MSDAKPRDYRRSRREPAVDPFEDDYYSYLRPSARPPRELPDDTAPRRSRTTRERPVSPSPYRHNDYPDDFDRPRRRESHRTPGDAHYPRSRPGRAPEPRYEPDMRSSRRGPSLDRYQQERDRYQQERGRRPPALRRTSSDGDLRRHRRAPPVGERPRYRDPHEDEDYRGRARRRNRSEVGRDPHAAASPSRHRDSRSKPPQKQARAKSTPSRGWKPPLDNIVWQTAGRTALEAGAQAAFKMRGEPGSWVGPKGAKVASVAVTAALVDSFVNSKHPNRSGGKRHQAARKVAEGAMSTAAARAGRRHS